VPACKPPLIHAPRYLWLYIGRKRLFFNGTKKGRLARNLIVWLAYICDAAAQAPPRILYLQILRLQLLK